MVRLASGQTAYYAIIEGMVDSAGLPVEQWGRPLQAHRFCTEDDARRAASGMQTNAMAKEYLVVPLPPQRR